MKTLKKKSKLTAHGAPLLMLFASCTVYQSIPVTLNKAVEENKKTKIEMLDGKALRFNSVVFEENNFYGIKKIRNNMDKKVEKNLLDEKTIATVTIKDKKRSTIATLILSSLVLGTAFYIYDNYVGIEMWGNRP